MLEYRTALGFSPNTSRTELKDFDRYCAALPPDCNIITKELVFDWLGKLTDAGRANIDHYASAVRHLAEYMNAAGQEAYVLPTGFYPYKSSFTAYTFSDAELSALFTAIDALPNTSKNNESIVAPVLFRLIYTCGLRPNEGRELRRENINLNNGEIKITLTKKKKERIVVMSSDMLKLCRKFDSSFLPEREYFFPQLSGKA
jgi:integrase